MEKDCGAWINLLSHKIKTQQNAMLQYLGITGVQSRVIYYILNHCKSGLVFQRDIESAFRLSRSTATGILQLLEKNGIIRRESVERDARLKSLVPTEKAVELDAQVRSCLQETDRLLTGGLSEGQIQLFKEIAAQMLKNLDNWEEKSSEASFDEASTEGNFQTVRSETKKAASAAPNEIAK